jgi:hypothetical protein
MQCIGIRHRRSGLRDLFCALSLLSSGRRVGRRPIGAGGTRSVSYKAPLPRDKIKRVLEGEILPTFTRPRSPLVQILKYNKPPPG